MIIVEQIFEDKNTILRSQISPNLYWNRFDLRYGDNYELWKIESDFGRHYVTSHLDNGQISVSMYMRRASPSIFDEFYRFLFTHYKNAHSIFILHTLTMNSSLEMMEHAHIEFPKTVDEFDASLSHRVRYNTKWYPKKIRETYGDYKIAHWNIKDTPKEIFTKYKEFKFATHHNEDNDAMSVANEVWVMYIGADVAAILQISDTSGEEKDAFLVNTTYNQTYAKYSPANVLYYAALRSLIERGYKRLFLFKMMDYKRHFNGIGKTSWTGTIKRRDVICPVWIEKLVHLPKWSHFIVKFLLPRTRYKRFFAKIVESHEEPVWMYLTEQDIGAANTDNQALAPSVFFHKILPILKDRDTQVFADIGCGDGFVLCKAAKLFHRVVGIEYDARIAKRCLDNMAKQKITNGELLNIDAANIPDEIMDAIDVFYLYNSFQGETFSKFIESVNRSISRRPRKAMFIYANPVCRDFCDNLKGFVLDREIPIGEKFSVLVWTMPIH